MYWSGSSFGGGWSDKPRAFRLRDTGVAGFFSYESATRRLVLNRFRPPEPLPSVEIAAGGEWAPQVSMDGRLLILVARQRRRGDVRAPQSDPRGQADRAAAPRAAIPRAVRDRRPVALLRGRG